MRVKNILPASQNSATININVQSDNQIDKYIKNKLKKQPQEIVFIDTAIYDYQTLVSGIKAGIEVVILDPTEDGIEQITRSLFKKYFDSVHIVSHGSPGCLYLGNSELSLTNLHFYVPQLESWFSPLSIPSSPKLLIYGCNVAVGDAGTEFVERLHEATRVTIAASTTKVGHSALGGNWELDFKVAKDKTVIDDVSLPFGENTLIHYPGVFANPGDVVINEVAWMGTNADSSHEWIELYNNTDQEIDLSGWSLVGIGDDVITIPGGQVIPANGYFLLESNENAVNDINADYVYSGTLSDNGERLSLIISDANETTVDTANNNGGGWPAGINVESSPNVRLTMERTNPLVSGTDSNWHTHTGVGRNGTDIDNGEIYGTPKALNSVPTAPGITVTPGSNLITTEDGEIATFDVVLDTVPVADVTINLSSDDESEGTVSTESLTFTPENWDIAQTVTVTGENDDIYDEDVSYNIIIEESISGDQRYSGIDTGDITVVNEDNDILSVGITVVNPQTPEATEADTPISKFQVTRNGTLGDLTVNLEVDSSSTISPEDYQLVGNSLSTTGLAVTIPDGESSVEFEVTPVDDNIPENDEILQLNVVPNNNYTVDSSNSNGTVTITANDEISYAISGTISEINEGDTSTQTLSFTVTRSGGIGVQSSIDYSIGGTANLGSDYNNIQVSGGLTTQTGTLNFAPEETQKTITLDVIGDDGFEVDETIGVVLSNPEPAIAPANAKITMDTAAVKILNDDGQPVISTNGFSIAEGDSQTKTGSFQVSLSNPSTETVTVEYITADDTARVDDGDYIAKSGTVTFQPGETSKQVDVEINGDRTFEGEESFKLDLSNPINANLSNDISTSGVGIIENDDNQPSISITDFSITEGNQDTQEIIFNVSLSNPSGERISVDYSTSDDTAEASDNDYIAIENTTLVFEPGETSKNITVDVIGDIKSEPIEEFNVNLSNPTGATIAKGTGVGKIGNDDNKPSINIDDITLAEGESKDFTVTLSNPSSEEITVSYSSSDDTATLQDSDYNFTNGTLFFAPGETSQTISFTTLDDDKFEDDETVNINLTSASGASINQNQGIATIENNDEEPTITITGVEVIEGDTGTQEASVIVSLSNPSSKPITVDYQTTDDTATSIDQDYNPLTLSTLTFQPGETEQSIKVEINSDTKFEGSETFNINLSNPNNATLAADTPGVVTITNDDQTPRLTIDDVSIAESDNGIKKAIFTVNLSNPSGETISVDYSTSPDSAIASTPESIGDYNSVTDTIIFNPGETSKNIEIEVNGDNIFESDESFSVNLVSTDNVDFDKDTGFVTIRNDDPEPTISVEDISVNEGESADFEVTLSNPSSSDIILNYSTNDDTATTIDNDYVPDNSNSITFLAGETSKNISIGTTEDSKFEGNEAFNLSLDSANGAIISDSKNLGIATINNNDQQPTISIEDISVDEGEIGEFKITLSNPSSETITVSYQSEDGDATILDNDYTPIQDTITFAPDEVSKTISLNTTDDNLFEGNETVNIKLSDATNATISDPEGTVTITNNDDRPTIDIQNNITITEGDNGIQLATFNVTLSNPSSEVVSVRYSTQNGTANNTDNDYNPIQNNILTFQPGETNQTISVEINGDTQFEDEESFNVILTNPLGGTLNTDTGVIIIENDDQEPGISIEDVTIIEGETANVKVNLTNTSSKAVTLNFSTSDDTATADDPDYTPVTSQSIVFQPGETSKTISISSIADNKFETDESFSINLDSPENATLDQSTSTIGIINNDQIPTVSIQESLDILEGNIDTSTATFQVTLSNPSSETIQVNYSTSDGSASEFDGDYNPVSDTLTFASGEISKTISVDINGETTFEEDEQFSINLSNPNNVQIAESTGTLTITNDDDQPTISVSNSTVNFPEGDGGISNAIIEVNLSQTAGVPVSFDYSTIDNTASSGSDYTETTGTITFTPGFEKQTINIPVVGDFVDEDEENFFVEFSNVKNATIIDNQVGIVITDNDTAGLKVEPIGNFNTTEGEETIFTMQLESQPTDEVEFNLNTSNILEGTLSTHKVIFTPENWNQPQSIKVTGIDDGVVDGNGNYQITISQATSNDSNYNQLPGKTLNFTNNDNDIAPTREINGTPTDEILIGTNSSDRINGNGGNDLVIGKQGYDEITTGNGQDTIFGDVPNKVSYSNLLESDKIISGGGDDIIFGGSGGDFIYGEAGSDRIYGEVGDDRIWGGTGDDIVSGGMGKDIFYLAPGEGRDTITDFDIDEDLIALSGGLSYSDLSLSQDNIRTLISVDGSVLAAVNNVVMGDLTQDSFITI
ncbi:MAG: Calx-beta domain-containing protein [Cyanobacteria bacterium P01_A01_bin.45]